MKFIGYLIFYFIGFYLSSFGFFQILASLFCAIPMTWRLKKFGAIQHQVSYKKISFTIIMNVIISSLVITLVLLFNHYVPLFGGGASNVAFGVGILIGLLFTIPNCRCTDTNMQEFIQNNIEIINIQMLDNFIDEVIK